MSLDPFAVLAGLGLDGVEGATPITGGADAAIWRVERGAEAFALRVLRPEQAAMAEREAAAMRAALAGGVPVPAIRAEGRWRERPALLLDWCPGRTLAAELTARPWRAYGLGVAFGRVQAAIHAAPLAAGALPRFEPAAADDALRARLAALPPRPPALLHLDYHPLNVLVDGGHIAGVLDWANTRVGDPRFDLARTLTILRLAPVPGGLLAPPARLALQALAAGWRRGYRERAGPAGDLRPFLAWAGGLMVRELVPRVGRPDLPWLTEAHLARVRRQAAAWRAAAGLPAERPAEREPA